MIFIVFEVFKIFKIFTSHLDLSRLHFTPSLPILSSRVDMSPVFTRRLLPSAANRPATVALAAAALPRCPLLLGAGSPQQRARRSPRLVFPSQQIVEPHRQARGHPPRSGGKSKEAAALPQCPLLLGAGLLQQRARR